MVYMIIGAETGVIVRVGVGTVLFLLQTDAQRFHVVTGLVLVTIHFFFDYV